MTTSRRLYVPEGKLENIGSYTLKTMTSITPAVVSVDLATFKNFLNSQSNYIKALNSNKAVTTTIIVYVAYVDEIYRCRVGLNYGGAGNELLAVLDTDYNTVVSTVLSSSGISLNPTFSKPTMATSIVLNDVTYVYNSRPVTKFYGPVNGEAELASKVYGPVNGQAKIIYPVFGHLDYSPSTYGRVTYYSGFTLGGDFKGDYSTGLTINSINHSQFYQYITQRNWLLSNGRTNMWFWMDGSNMMVNAERKDGNWENNIPAQQVFQGGISVTLTSQSGNLVLEYGAESIDTTSAQVTVDLLSNTEYQGLGNSDSAQTGVNYTIGGNTVPRNAVTGFQFGTQNTSTPNYFLYNATGLTNLSIPEGTCPTTIGQAFLGYCTSFNQAIILPDTTTIGGSFLTSCTSFNKRIYFPKVTSIGNYFMYNCNHFNQYLELPAGLTSIGSYFMHLCSVFNQDITLPQTLTSIDVAFMQGCNAFTQLVHLGSLSADIAATSTRTFCATSNTAPCYVTGIGLIDNTEGTTVAAWKAKFPDSATNWRKLVDRTSSTGGGN